MRLIDAEFTVYAAESEFDEEDASKIRWLISHIPTVDAEPVRHGEWVATKIDATVTDFRCSECGRYIMCRNDYYMKPTKHANKSFPYCHCGAKMDGGKQDG